VSQKPYRIEVRRTAHKDLLGLPPKISEQVERTIDRLAAQLNAGRRPQDVKKLVGLPNTYRIDSGDYRILFELDDEERVATIARVRHRKDAYRNL
jgi:mRNA interferase RelE/StbE